MSTVRPLIAAAVIAFPSAAAPSISVAELRSRLTPAETGLPDGDELAERVRDVARRTLPDAQVLDDTEEGGDLQVSGDLIRIGQGLMVTLELREAQSGRLGATASARAGTADDLIDAVASASVELFRAWKETSSLAMNGARVPDAPGPLPWLQPAGNVSPALGADLLIAFEEARAADGLGKEQPEAAAAAWRTVAEAVGPNPFREAAAARAAEWQAWAQDQRAFEDQRSRDTARMRRVLPLVAITDETKVELLVRYTRAYGVERARPLIAFLPAPLRPRADLAVGCQAKQAEKCVALALAADAANDRAQAAEYFSRACGAGDSRSCAEAGDRFLQPETRDVGRAFLSLQTGCDDRSAQACARLARVYEEGDGADVDLTTAAEMRDRACTAGDGESCRKLACNANGIGAAAALWAQGCKDGDVVSCTLAGAASPQPAPAAAAPAPAPERKHRRGAGATFIGIALVAGGAAAILAMHDDHGAVRGGWHWQSRALREAEPAPSPGRSILPIALGATAAISAVAGLGLLFWSDPGPAPGKVRVGIGPNGIALSGSLP